RCTGPRGWWPPRAGPDPGGPRRSAPTGSALLRRPGSPEAGPPSAAGTLGRDGGAAPVPIEPAVCPWPDHTISWEAGPVAEAGRNQPRRPRPQWEPDPGPG